MKKSFYWDTHVHCYDCYVDGQKYFWTWTDGEEWDSHTGEQQTNMYTIGDVQVPDTCLILQQVPVNDENFL